MTEFVLECTGVSKKYGKKEVLKNINLQLERGKIIGLLGPNGSGKTTLIKIINGLLTADEGDIKVSGEQIGIESKKGTKDPGTLPRRFPNLTRKDGPV